MKVLVVEDDATVRETLLEILKRKHVSAEGASSAEEALGKLPGDYGVVLTDVNLGSMDGVELLAQVTGRHPGLPVVVMSGVDDREIRERCRRGGAAEFLHKPFTMMRLFDVIKRVNH